MRTHRNGADTAPPSAAGDETALVERLLAEFRRELYGGRGPGIGEEEWLRSTRDRPTVAGVPPAVSREQIHLRTLQARGERASARIEADWAAAQFPQLAGTRPAGGHRPARRSGGGALALIAVCVLTWMRSRRSRRAPGTDPNRAGESR